jgi:thiol-disulfide isomerase/thioredoxin
MTRRHLFSFIALALAVPSPEPARAARDLAAESAPAPTFSLPGRTGTVSLGSFRGQLVYVDFWASWCGPCQQSFPWMTELHDKYGRQGLVIVAIDLDKDRTAADKFLNRHPSPFLVAYDPAGKTAEAFDVSAMPSSYLIGADGKVIHAMAGFDSDKRQETESLIQRALKP